MSDDDSESINPCETFLEYLEYPEDESLNIDLKLTAVALMCELERLTKPYFPPPTLSKASSTSSSAASLKRSLCVSASQQEIGFWGQGKHNY